MKVNLAQQFHSLNASAWNILDAVISKTEI